MIEVDLSLEVLAADYGVNIDLETGRSLPQIDVVAKSDDLPHRFPLRLSLASELLNNACGEPMVEKSDTNILRPRSERTSGYCAFIILPPNVLLEVAPLVLSQSLAIIGCTAFRLPDGNSFKLKKLDFIANSNVEDVAFG